MESSRPVSDPARDYIRSLDLFAAQDGADVASCVAAASRTMPWSGDFYHVIKLLQETIENIHQQLIADEYLDEDDQNHLRSEIERLAELYNVSRMAQTWKGASAPGSPAGPEARTFLKSASRQLRAKGSYVVLNESDINLISSAIDIIRADITGFQLDRADFAREALLRGCGEVSFIFARIDVLGFSRLEAPIMELGAFLYTIAEEVRRADGNDVRVKKSMASLSRVYGRLYELSKIASMAKVGWDGANWLLSHL